MKYVVQMWDLYGDESTVEDVYETEDYIDACEYARTIKRYCMACDEPIMIAVAEKLQLENEEDL